MILVIRILLRKELLLLQNQIMQNETKELHIKTNVPFINCIPKINCVQIDNADDLDVVMPMYNLLEYSKNYRKKKQATCGIITEMN